MLREYNHLPGFLLRWTLFKFGRLHIRLHHIIATDGTPFLHTHPFSYISIIYKGGYTESILKDEKLITVDNSTGSIVIRSSMTPHRITKLHGDICKTIFITLSSNTWKLITHEDIVIPSTYKTPKSSGVYKRIINNNEVYAKFDKFWYSSKDNVKDAMKSDNPSIYQCDNWKEL
ncbi:hypothetical protein K9M47_00375 [Candidatus Gracilibacteria bacterium]|nr:hypothetical protein [Candidatus Gracilibacteria bacterium]MCF7898572.1 hypothetical protein [Candidatus Paceibacterota bacterium]